MTSEVFLSEFSRGGEVAKPVIGLNFHKKYSGKKAKKVNDIIWRETLAR